MNQAESQGFDLERALSQAALVQSCKDLDSVICKVLSVCLGYCVSAFWGLRSLIMLHSHQ